MKLTKKLIEQAYRKALNQDIREQDNNTVTSFAEALFEEFQTLFASETVKKNITEMANIYIDSLTDYKNNTVFLPKEAFHRLNLLLNSLGIPLPANVEQEINIKESTTLKCDLCDYVGTETNPVGECPKCNWDELQPVRGISSTTIPSHISKEPLLLDAGKQAEQEVFEYQKCGCKQTTGSCTLAGPGRGDCEHHTGLPGISIPDQHDGPNDTVDAHGKPNGWCWQCWKSKQIEMLQEQVAATNKVIDSTSITETVTPEYLQNIELYRLQIAGISTASLGYWKKGDSIHPNYITPALHDVASLYSKYEELYKLCEKHNLVGSQPSEDNSNNIHKEFVNIWKTPDSIVPFDFLKELPLTITQEYVDLICGNPENAHYTLFPDTFHTVCCISLPNGATMIGDSVCAASKIFNEKLGREYAFKQAKEKVWQFEGYALCEKRYQAGLNK